MKIVVFLGLVLTALPAAAKVFFGRVDQSITLECGISTNPTILEWFYNEQRVLRVDHKGFTTKAQSNIAKRSKTRGSNLEISNLKKEDAGKFTCKANRESREHWLYFVSVVVTPSGVLQEGSDASLQCEVHKLDQRTTVKWHRPDGSIINDKTVDFKPVRTSHGGNWTCEVTAEGGESFKTSLIITVKPSAPTTTKSSMNSITKGSKNTTCVSCTTDHQQGFPRWLGLDWWIWVALGGSTLILILLVISIVLVSRRARRKKKKMQMMKKAQQQQRAKKYCQCQSRQPAAKPAGKSQQRGRREKPSPLPLQPLLTE
ncbi:CD4-2 molecule, tandem duplicate 2 [Oryzias melastigma]|uniref:CD4-2 molecule, tandem duplicate 2 n=1 Tax=Oryzias melastigma TaxID=30732 RepID=UPI000CF814EB|nr:CD4-2 molecule, tandem duplicate 2 [Oryzias melastigma]XP_036071990.1 CD4-2 molecule, tandem duplicate 2 [Oryzias melastigma]